jgi:hypothetical protein
MMICFSAITAIRRELKTAKFFGTPNGPPLQRRADALATPLLPYRKGVYLCLSEWDAIQNQWRAVGFRTDGLDTETQEADHLLILQGHAEVAKQMAGIFAQDERRLLGSRLLQALYKLFPARVCVVPFLKCERLMVIRFCHSVMPPIRFVPCLDPRPCRVEPSDYCTCRLRTCLRFAPCMVFSTSPLTMFHMIRRIKLVSQG